MTDKISIHLRLDPQIKVLMDEAMKKMETNQYIEVSAPAFIKQAIVYYANEIKENEIGLVLRRMNGKHK